MKKKQPPVKKEVLESIEDDVQARLDALFERITFTFKKEAALVREDGLRGVCVDYAHVDASVVHEIYDRLVAATFKDDSVSYYLGVWKRVLQRDS